MSHQKIHQTLIERKQTLALAESCTGGRLSAQITSLADASKYFLGALVTYSNALKEELLGVSRKTLVSRGAASREVASEMLLGLMKSIDADYGVAVTGIAGPSGGAQDRPVGTVYIALGERGKKPHVIHCHLEGDRQEIIASACARALEELAFLIG